MNKKSYSFDMETFRNMLLICPKLPRQKFVDPPFEEEILTFIRELGYPGNIKLLSDVKVKSKPKYIRRSSRTKTDEAPKPSSSKSVKSTAKVAKSRKKKQPALGLETLYEIALTEAEKLKLATKRSLIQTHNSHISDFGAHEGTGVTLGVLDVPDYESDDEQISWKSNEEEDDDEVNVSEQDDEDDDERTEFDNDGEDFVCPKFSTHDDEARQEEVIEEDSFDPRVQTPSHVESKDDDNSDETIHCNRFL
ncbi:hypothetical protein Tco_0627430 [Tanacetum coccineum]|uniref:Transposase n=1 Tax=Tanacetum coccineum TaxID=301880 RepID=A0ABQ4WMM5_9ASTR